MTSGTPSRAACVTATLLDGLVLARSARYHSMNYRSVTIHGRATPVTEPDRILAGLRALVDHMTPGRWEQVRKPSPAEVRETALWQVPIEAASVKSRSGPALDPVCDWALPVWAGHIPAQLVFGPPIPADGLPPGTEPASYLRKLPTAVERGLPALPAAVARGLPAPPGPRDAEYRGTS